MASDLGIIFFDAIRFLVGMSIPIGSLALKNAVMLYLDEVFDLTISSMNIRIVINLVSMFAGYALFLICYPSAASTMPYIPGFAMSVTIIAATMIACGYISQRKDKNDIDDRYYDATTNLANSPCDRVAICVTSYPKSIKVSYA